MLTLQASLSHEQSLSPKQSINWGDELKLWAAGMPWDALKAKAGTKAVTPVGLALQQQISYKDNIIAH